MSCDRDGYGVGMTWYHGSQQELVVLRPGSSITERVAIARAFSHRPTIVSVDDAGVVKHDGSEPGFLYEVAEEVAADDIEPHPHPINASGWEWLTKRELAVRLVEHTQPRPGDLLTDADLAELERRRAAAGATGSFRTDEP